ncbi:membrane protein [Streptomyces thermolineatus]|uniref:Membrane protein n=1 Tax=Streptomyces thermolineatus TaxID=44033 RepID=A0ABN3M7S0_9ACTN
MARRPLPTLLRNPYAALLKGRGLVRTAADNAVDVFHPLITVGRGLRRLLARLRARWDRTPGEQRGPLLFIAAAVVAVIAILPYGPAVIVAATTAAAAWAGRERPVVATGPGPAALARLRCLYEALVPHFGDAGDPEPLYSYRGDHTRVFDDCEFDGEDRPVRLRLRYPAYFDDGDPASRERIEQLLHAKAGRGREYRFDWDEEGNSLTVTALEPLPCDVGAQRFVTAPGEILLGITDACDAGRTVPVEGEDGGRDAPPVLWRTGVRSTEPHLLVLGEPGSGTTTLLRSIALQALEEGELLVLDGGGTGGYACLAGRHGVLAVESDLAGALAGLEWAAHETERRLAAVNAALRDGRPVPEDACRPLWLLVDRPGVLGRLARAEDRPDPQDLLEVPLRHGRAANVTVVLADEPAAVGNGLSAAVCAGARARVALGPLAPGEVRAVLGVPAPTSRAAQVPPGRGYARLGSGPAVRLQVPAVPDPYDEEVPEARRRAVLELLPPRRKTLRAVREPAVAEG